MLRPAGMQIAIQTALTRTISSMLDKTKSTQMRKNLSFSDSEEKSPEAAANTAASTQEVQYTFPQAGESLQAGVRTYAESLQEVPSSQPSQDASLIAEQALLELAQADQAAAKQAAAEQAAAEKRACKQPASSSRARSKQPESDNEEDEEAEDDA